MKEINRLVQAKLFREISGQDDQRSLFYLARMWPICSGHSECIEHYKTFIEKMVSLCLQQTWIKELSAMDSHWLFSALRSALHKSFSPSKVLAASRGASVAQPVPDTIKDSLVDIARRALDHMQQCTQAGGSVSTLDLNDYVQDINMFGSSDDKIWMNQTHMSWIRAMPDSEGYFE